MDSKAKKLQTVTLAMSPRTFAKSIDRSVGFVRLEIQRGALKVIKRGRAILITKAAADQYLSG